MILITDDKVTIWRRSWIKVDSDNTEEALKKYKNGDFEIEDSRLLYETEEPIPKDPPIEVIYDESYNEIQSF